MAGVVDRGIGNVFGGDSTPDMFVFRPQSLEQDLTFALGRAGDPQLLQDIRSGVLSGEERSQLLSGLFDLPKNQNIELGAFIRTAESIRKRFEDFQRPRVEQRQATENKQKEFKERPGLEFQTRQSILTGGGRVVPGAAGGSIITGGA